MEFKPLDSPPSKFNSGWRFGVTVGSSAVLLFTLMPLLAIALEILI